MPIGIRGGLSLEALGHLRAEVPSCADDGGKIRHLQLEALTDSLPLHLFGEGAEALEGCGSHA